MIQADRLWQYREPREFFFHFTKRETALTHIVPAASFGFTFPLHAGSVGEQGSSR
jgi:hypothetical protein